VRLVRAAPGACLAPCLARRGSPSATATTSGAPRRPDRGDTVPAVTAGTTVRVRTARGHADRLGQLV